MTLLYFRVLIDSGLNPAIWKKHAVCNRDTSVLTRITTNTCDVIIRKNDVSVCVLAKSFKIGSDLEHAGRQTKSLK